MDIDVPNDLSVGDIISVTYEIKTPRRIIREEKTATVKAITRRDENISIHIDANTEDTIGNSGEKWKILLGGLYSVDTSVKRFARARKSS